MNTTEEILSKINDGKSKQADVAKVCAVAIETCMNAVDWKAVNAAIVERWSPSACERVLTMAWKIVEAQ